MRHYVESSRYLVEQVIRLSKQNKTDTWERIREAKREGLERARRCLTHSPITTPASRTCAGRI